MNIAKHMEAIFVGAVLLLGCVNFATARVIKPATGLSPTCKQEVQPADSIPSLPYVLVAANL